MSPCKSKMTRAARQLALALLASFVLVSCGGGESTPAPPATTETGVSEVLISGRAAKGTILNGTVRATQIINGQLSGTQKDVALGPNGDFTVSMPRGLIHLQLITKANSTTQDEATGVAVALPLEFKFRAAADLTDLRATTVSLNITPFAEASVALAEKSGGLTAANINKANSGIANILGFDYLSTTPIQSSDTAGLASATTNEKKLSVLNAAVSNIAATDALGCGVKASYGQTIDCTIAKLADQFQMNNTTSAKPTAARMLPMNTANSTPMVLLRDEGYQSLLEGVANVANSGVTALKDATIEIAQVAAASAVSAATYAKGVGEKAISRVENTVEEVARIGEIAWDEATRQNVWSDYRSGIVVGKDDFLIKAANDYYKYAVMSDLIYKDCRSSSDPNECYDPPDQWFNGRPDQPVDEPLLLISMAFDGVNKGKGVGHNAHTAPGVYRVLNWETYGIRAKDANDVDLQWNAFYNNEEIVFVYRGTELILASTDLATDLAIRSCNSSQYKVALDQFDAVIVHSAFDEHRLKNIVLTGHSLGGGIASYIAYKRQSIKKISAVGFNSAPQCTIGGIVGNVLSLSPHPSNIIQLDIKGQFLRSSRWDPKLYFPVQQQNLFQYPNPYAIGITNQFDSHTMAWMLFALDAAKSWCGSTSVCTTSAAQLPVSQTPLVVNGMGSVYTTGVSPYRPAISLSGSNLRAIDKISWACTQPNGAACLGSPYIWTPNDWTGKAEIINDTKIKVYPRLLALGDATGTYSWTATFSALDYSSEPIPFSVVYQLQAATGIVVESLTSNGFSAGTKTISTTTNPVAAALTVTGKNLSAVTRIEWRWTGAATGSKTWLNSDPTWNSRVTYTPDGKLILSPAVVEANPGWSGLTVWTGTLLDAAGASRNITFSVVYQPPVSPASPTLGFTSPSLGTVSATTVGYQPTITASGNVTQVSFNWSGATSGSATWVKNDANWLSKVTTNLDGSITLRPVVTQASDLAGTTDWTVTLRDSAGTTQAQTFTVNYQPATTAATAVVSFSDNFDRPDSSAVGNGWITSKGSKTDLQIKNNEVTGGSGGMYRPQPFNGPVTVSATLKEKNGYGGLLRQYGAALSILSDGDLGRGHGYGVLFSRSDQNYNNSTVALIDGLQEIIRIDSSVQYGPQIRVRVVFSLDGSVAGTVGDGANTFNFSFGPRTIQSTGANFAYFTGAPDARSAVITYPRLDDVVVSTTVAASAPQGASIAATK